MKSSASTRASRGWRPSTSPAWPAASTPSASAAWTWTASALGGVDAARRRRRAHEPIAAGPSREATVYIQAPRGAAPRPHPSPPDVAPLEFLFVQESRAPYVEARRDGAGVITHPDQRWD